MSLKLKDIIIKDVHALITSLTGYEESQENFEACDRFIMSNLIHHRNLSVDKHAVRRSVDGMATKFHVHGLFNKGGEFESVVKEFLTTSNFKDHGTPDLEWCLLSFLLKLAQNPTNVLGTSESTSQSFISVCSNDDDDDDIDWVAYLKEGEEDFFQSWSSDSCDEDEVDRMGPVENVSAMSQPTKTEKSGVLPATSCLLESHKSTDVLSLKEQVDTNKSSAFNAQSILNAECWLRSNVQHDWWTQKLYHERPQSTHPFSQTAHLCNPAEDIGIQPSTFSEHKVVLETIWLLSAPCDTAVFMRVISDDGCNVGFHVRPHVTTPSLTQDVFYSLMSPFCVIASMVEELQSFCAMTINTTDQKKPCSTFQAYRCALKHELRPFFEALSNLEQQAHKQSDTFTLLILKEELRPYLLTVRSLHTLHKSAVLDHTQHPSWLCATHLLSVIISSLKNAEEVIGMSFRIFVQSFQVYITIIDQWLTSGQLYDTHDEFFIRRMEKKSSSLGEIFEKRDWEKAIMTLGAEPPRALQVLDQYLLKAAQHLHVLCELNRLPELRRLTSGRCSFKHLFLQNLIGYLQKTQSTPLSSVKEIKKERDLWWKQLDHLISEVKVENLTPKPTKHNSTIDVKAVISHLHRLEEPLLLKGFQTLFCNPPEVSTWNPHGVKAEDLLMKSVPEQMPLEPSVERALLCLSADWEGIAGGLVADILIQEHQLFYHLHTAQSVFLLQSSHKLQPFLSHFFELILHRANLMWMNSHNLSILLQDCMDSEQFSVSVTTERNPTEMNALDCIDCIQLKYQLDWPLCAVLGEKGQHVYNFILRFLLKMRWGLWLIEGLSTKDFKHSDESPLSKRLLHLRYWLLHILRGSYSFLAGHILNGLWLKFEEDIKCTKNMHSLIQVHGRFLECALQRSLCPNKPEPVKNALFQLVILAENLHSLWNCGMSKLSISKLSNIEVCYSQCHRFLATSLYSLAEVEDLQHVMVLSNLFNWNVPEETIP